MDQKKKYFDIYAPVFYPAAFIVVTTILLSFFFSEDIIEIFSTIQEGSSNHAGWFFILSMNVYVFAALFFGLSKYGNIRLGGADAQPEFSTFSWFSMLFSAGIGIGLLFYGVAEPMYHFSTPPMPTEDVVEKARQAMLFTFLHWGLHGWSPYVILGMALAFFTYNKGLPLTVRSLFFPLIGSRIHGWMGNSIDVLAVVATLFGLATSLGIGVQQIGAGMEFLFAFKNQRSLHILLICLITLAATSSVVLGLDKGVRFLSVVNIRLAGFFLILMLLIGPTIYLLDGFVQNLGQYFNSFLQLGTWTETYTGTKWQNDWTIFYWSWWISWSPFVGIFIARVSKGRTIREFVLGVLFVPTLLIFFWMSVFGGTAIYLEMNGLANISEAVNKDLSTSLFVLLNEFPISSITSFVGILLVTIFFVTSSDSGSLVVDSITSGGKLDAPVGQRIFWALLEGGVAAALIFAGGTKALQTVVISTGLPFAILILFVVYALFKAFREEYKNLETLKKQKQKEGIIRSWRIQNSEKK